MNNIIVMLIYSPFLFYTNLNVSQYNPDIEIKISLEKEIYKISEEIPIILEIKNTSDKNEMLLFEIKKSHPRYGLTANLIDANTKKSVVKWQKSQISSQIFSDKQLDPYKFKLSPKQTIIKMCNLSDIVVFNTKDFELSKGTYELKLQYYSKFSNKIVLQIN